VFVTVLAVMLTASVGTGRAVEPFALSFDQGEMGISGVGADEQRLDYGAAGKAVTMEGTLDGGTIDIPASGVAFPAVNFNAGGSVGLVQFATWTDAPVSGSFDSTTGSLSLDISLMVRMDTTLGISCTFGPIPLSLTTGYEGERSGAGFLLGAEGNGAVGGELEPGTAVANTCPMSTDIGKLSLWLGATKGPSPFKAGFERSYLQIGSYKVLEKAAGMRLDGRIQNGRLTVPAAGVTFPGGSLTVDGKTSSVALTAPGGTTGSFSSASGQLDLQYGLMLDVTGGAVSGKCLIGPVPVQLSSGYAGVPAGVPFTGGLDGRGLAGAAWEGKLQAAGGGCPASLSSALQNARVSMVFASGQPAPDVFPECATGCESPGPDPKPDLVLTPVKKKINLRRKQKSVAVKVKVKNRGDGEARAVKICFSGPAWALKKKTCRTLAKLGAGASSMQSVTLKPKRVKKARTAAIKVTAAGQGVAQRSAKVQVRVPRR